MRGDFCRVLIDEMDTYYWSCRPWNKKWAFFIFQNGKLLCRSGPRGGPRHSCATSSTSCFTTWVVDPLLPPRVLPLIDAPHWCRGLSSGCPWNFKINECDCHQGLEKFFSLHELKQNHVFLLKIWGTKWIKLNSENHLCEWFDHQNHHWSCPFENFEQQHPSAQSQLQIAGPFDSLQKEIRINHTNIMYCSVTPQYHPSRQNRIHVVGQDLEEGIKNPEAGFQALFFAHTFARTTCLMLHRCLYSYCKV